MHLGMVYTKYDPIMVSTNNVVNLKVVSWYV